MAFISRICFTFLFTAAIASSNAQVADAPSQQPTRLLDIKGSANGVSAKIFHPIKNAGINAGLVLRYYWTNKQVGTAVKSFLRNSLPYIRAGTGVAGVLASLGLTYYLANTSSDVFVDEVNGIYREVTPIPPSIYSKKSYFTGTDLGGYNSLEEIGDALLKKYGAVYYNYKADFSTPPFVFDYHSLYSGSTYLGSYNFELFGTKGSKLMTYQAIKITQTCPSGRYSADINCAEELPKIKEPLTVEELVSAVPDEYQVPDSAIKEIYPFLGAPSKVEIVELPKTISDIQKLDDGSVKQIDVLPNYSISSDLAGSFRLTDLSSIRERVYQNGALIVDKTHQNSTVTSIAIDSDLDADNDDIRPIVLNPALPNDGQKAIDNPILIDNGSLAFSSTTTANSTDTKQPFSFCDTFSVVCKFFSWVQEPPQLEEPKIEPVKDYQINEKKVDINFGQHKCPAPIDLKLGFLGNFVIDLDFICKFAEYISYFVITAAYIVAIRINLNAIK